MKSLYRLYPKPTAQFLPPDVLLVPNEMEESVYVEHQFDVCLSSQS